MRFGFLQERAIFLLIGRCGIVENDDLWRMPVTPEMFVVVFYRFADIA